MSKYVWISLLCLSATSCGKYVAPYKDVELSLIATQFEVDTGVKTESITMRFNALDKSIMGICYTYDDDSKEIQINDAYWDKLNDVGRTQLMYHELGHCAMNLKHDETIVHTPDGQPLWGSIMYPVYFGYSPMFKLYEKKYIEALKNKTVISF